MKTGNKLGAVRQLAAFTRLLFLLPAVPCRKEGVKGKVLIADPACQATPGAG